MLTSVSETFDWLYSYRNEDPVDERFIEYWGEDNPIDIIYTRVECAKVSFFVNCTLDEE